MRIGKLNGYISALEGFRFKILLIVYINNTYNLMSTGYGYFFNLLTHLSVSNQCYFHLYLYIFVAKIAFFIVNRYFCRTFTAH